MLPGVGNERCPVCGEQTLDQRGRYDTCAVCSWSDATDAEGAPWAPSGNNGGVSLWLARVRYARPGVPTEALAGDLERLRQPEAERRLPGHLAVLGRILGTTFTRADVVPPREADRLSLAVWTDDAHRPVPGPQDDVLLDAADVDRVLAAARPHAPAILLDPHMEPLLGAVRVDPVPVTRRWRAYVEEHSAYLALVAPDLGGWLTVEPSGDRWRVVVAGAWL